ncbi:MAG: hypothetical protein KGM24_10495 [Elusimicrobia bacterium]|nr:hypothetical protein [Elusimicrobiota bacterium]
MISVSIFRMFHVSPAMLTGFYVLLAACGVLARTLPPRLRRAFLALAGLAFVARFFSATMAPALAALALLLWRVCDGGETLDARRTLAAAAVVAFGLGPACFGGFFAGYTHGHVRLQDLLTVMFLANMLKKSVYYVYERRAGRARSPAAGDFLAYFFALPFTVGSVIFAPSEAASRWEARSRRDDLLSGLRTLALAALHAGACWLLIRGGWTRAYDEQFLARAAALRWWQLWLIFVSTYVGVYLHRYALDQTCVGAARLLGWDVRGNYDWALFPADYADYWRRWNIHFRELLMALFYYPSALRLARRRPGRRETNLIAACFVTFAGAAVFNFVLHAAFYRPGFGAAYYNLAVRLALYEGFAWVMVSAAGIAEMRRRAAGKPEPGRWRRAAGVAITLLLRAGSVPIYLTDVPGLSWTVPVRLIAAAFGVPFRR